LLTALKYQNVTGKTTFSRIVPGYSGQPCKTLRIYSDYSGQLALPGCQEGSVGCQLFKKYWYRNCKYKELKRAKKISAIKTGSYVWAAGVCKKHWLFSHLAKYPGHFTRRPIVGHQVQQVR
jgi:hypothetical protein